MTLLPLIGVMSEVLRRFKLNILILPTEDGPKTSHFMIRRMRTLKRLNLGRLTKSMFLFFFSVLSLYVFSGWPIGFQALTTKKPINFFNSSTSQNVTILLWYWPFSKSLTLRVNVCWDLYRIPHCRLVDQRSLFSSADVVVFHNTELMQGRHKLPLDLPRPQGQRWAWMSLEAPNYNKKLQQYAHIFNMTITYRRDADITLPYGKLLPKEDGPLLDDVPLNKSSLVCWVVSNYQQHHKRSQVYRELSTEVPVNVYGRWKSKHLPSGDLLPTISRCYFYLAFENSVAKDYITEKLWRNAYQGGAVPVVMGPPLSDYKAVAPPHSFIHVDEFASVKDLGKYLRQLAEDKKLYGEYFAWKQNWKVKLYTDWRERLCNICLQYSSLRKQKVYPDLEAWVNPKNT